MLYVYYGDDTNRVRQAARTKAQSLLDAQKELHQIAPESYTPEILLSFAESASLFGGSEVFLLDTPSRDATCVETLLEAGEIIAESPHHFVVIEQLLTPTFKKAYTAYAQTINEFVQEKSEGTYNVFSLCDALLARDKKKLWLLLMESEGVPREEIIGVLLWQLKMLRLAECTTSAEEAGEKSFPYTKAKRALAKFKKGEPRSLAHALVLVYHRGHSGKGDIALGLEKWVLSL